jgi:tryptophan synthase alpha chain
VEESVSAAIATLWMRGLTSWSLVCPTQTRSWMGLIAEATQKALENGFKLKDLFPAIRHHRSTHDKPVLVMTYWNPVVQYGVENFARDLKTPGEPG